MENKVHLDNLAIYSKRGSFSGSAVIPYEQSLERGYHIPETESVRGYFEWSDLELEELQSSFFKETRLAGYSNGRLLLMGCINKPMINGDLSIKNGYFQLDPKTPQVNDIDIFIAFEDSSFRLEQFSGSIKNMPFELMGEISSTNWEHFRTHFDLNLSNAEVLSGSGTLAVDSLRLNLLMNQFNLDILQPFVSEFQQINGKLYAELNIEGLVNNPRINGFAEISNLSFKPSSINQTFSNGVIKASFDSHQMTLDTLSLRQDGGSIFAQGKVIEHNGTISQLEMNLDISDIKLERPDQFSVEINRGRFSYIKQGDYFQLDGDIRLGESHLINRFQPKDILSFFKTVEKPSHSRPEMLQRTKLNIRLKESGQVWIDNNLSNLRLRPALSVIGPATQPNITGRLVVEEGYILYLDRKFRVVRGILDFIDPSRINPIVDLQAVAKIKNYQTLNAIPYTISITITGPLDQVIFELTSDPSLEKSDIIALLTVGATREQLTKKEGGDQATIADVLKDRLAVISSEKVSGYAAQTVGNLFGLEAISIEGNLFRFGKSWGPQLLASKKLSDRVEITYTTTVGRMNEQNIRLDYLLSRYFSLEGQTDQRGKSGLDVKYRLEFK
jgi:autotransporter translocation and assembly factor TamB